MYKVEESEEYVNNFFGNYFMNDVGVNYDLDGFYRYQTLGTTLVVCTM